MSCHYDMSLSINNINNTAIINNYIFSFLIKKFECGFFFNIVIKKCFFKKNNILAIHSYILNY